MFRSHVSSSATHFFAIVAIVAVNAASAQPVTAQPTRQPDYGPNPTLARADTTAVREMIARVVGWPRGATPRAAPGLAVSLYAAGLQSPRNLHVLPNSDVLVVESSNPGTSRDWAMPPERLAAWYASRIRGPSANRITLLRDTNRDGRPDVRSVLVRDLNQPFGVALAGQWLYVANTNGVIRFPFAPGDTSIAAPAEHVADLPAGGYNNHWTRNLLISPDGRVLYITVGSATNIDLEGIDATDPRRAAILELPLDVGATPRVFASGLRNPVGVDWNPATGELWTAVNERDGLGDDVPPDYVTSVRRDGFYGWPWSYWGGNEDPRLRRRNTAMVARAITPDFATGAHTATLLLRFYRGTSLPSQYRGSLLVAQRGSWNRGSPVGYRVGFIPFVNGRPAGPMQDFLTGFIADPSTGDVYGRPVGLAELADGSVLVSDDASNVIWRVRAAQ